MELDKIAQNLYKKQEGRYLIYEMEGKRMSFRHMGKTKRILVASVRRDVFGKKIELFDSKGNVYDFREPTYISRSEDGGFSFTYLRKSDRKIGDEDVMEEQKVDFKPMPQKTNKDTKSSNSTFCV